MLPFNQLVLWPFQCQHRQDSLYRSSLRPATAVRKLQFHRPALWLLVRWSKGGGSHGGQRTFGADVETVQGGSTAEELKNQFGLRWDGRCLQHAAVEAKKERRH